MMKFPSKSSGGMAPHEMVKNQVAKGEGAKLQKGNKSAPGLADKGIGAKTPVKKGMVENKVAGGAGVRLQSSQNRTTDLNDMGVGKMSQHKGLVLNKVK